MRPHLTDCQSETCSVPPGSILGAVLFNVFINNLDAGFERTISQLAGDTKQRGVVGALGNDWWDEI